MVVPGIENVRDVLFGILQLRFTCIFFLESNRELGHFSPNQDPIWNVFTHARVTFAVN